MQFYGKKRFDREDYGVTQPCQIQCISYFERFITLPTYFPHVLCIKKVTFKGNFQLDSPYIKLVTINGDVRYNTKSIDSSLVVEKANEYSIVFTQKHYFAGDMTLELKESKVIGKNLIITYVFNTAFVNCLK